LVMGPLMSDFVPDEPSVEREKTCMTGK
jgi:hypothetical protein